MSVVKRGAGYSLAIRPFGKLVYVKTSARSKAEARQVEAAILMAIRANDYRMLDMVSREACMRLFQNQGLEIPSTLSGEEPVQQELTLMEAAKIFLRYPSIKDCKAKERYKYSLINLVEKLGKDRPIKKLWVPDLRLYQSDRVSSGAAPGTVNKELGTLSRLFSVLIELQMVDANPCRLVKSLTEGRREVYISAHDFRRIVDVCPDWYQPFLWTAYYTGMRRGELFTLSRKQVNLSTRIIRLGDRDTKERRSKRVPIHRDLVPVLEQCMRIRCLSSDKVFLIQDSAGVREPSIESIKNPWRREIAKLGFDPLPHLHDVRHTWKTNARRSGMHPEIEKAIMGHSEGRKSVHERYGVISDRELVEAIDAMSFDHGATEIYAVR
jgi:integrase